MNNLSFKKFFSLIHPSDSVRLYIRRDGSYYFAVFGCFVTRWFRSNEIYFRRKIDLLKFFLDSGEVYVINL